MTVCLSALQMEFLNLFVGLSQEQRDFAANLGKYGMSSGQFSFFFKNEIAWSKGLFHIYRAKQQELPLPQRTKKKKQHECREESDISTIRYDTISICDLVGQTPGLI